VSREPEEAAHGSKFRVGVSEGWRDRRVAGTKQIET